MSRIHLFEFEDFNWFPESLRNMMTDYLHFITEKFYPYDSLVPKIKEVMKKLNCHQIIDLCSGGSGPLPQIQQNMEKNENFSVSVTLTDKYPNIKKF